MGYSIGWIAHPHHRHNVVTENGDELMIESSDSVGFV